MSFYIVLLITLLICMKIIFCAPLFGGGLPCPIYDPLCLNQPNPFSNIGLPDPSLLNGGGLIPGLPDLSIGGGLLPGLSGLPTGGGLIPGLPGLPTGGLIPSLPVLPGIPDLSGVPCLNPLDPTCAQSFYSNLGLPCYTCNLFSDQQLDAPIIEDEIPPSYPIEPEFVGNSDYDVSSSDDSPRPVEAEIELKLRKYEKNNKWDELPL